MHPIISNQRDYLSKQGLNKGELQDHALNFSILSSFSTFMITICCKNKFLLK